MKPICVPCERFMRTKKSGFYFMEGRPGFGEPRWSGGRGKDSVGWVPYKLWAGDLYECPDCHAQTIVGTGKMPIAEHYQHGFAEAVEHTRATLLIKDC